MNHIAEDELLKYELETSTDDAERARIAEHLAVCPECLRRLEDLREDIEIIGGIRPLRPVLRIPSRRVSSGLIYRSAAAAVLIMVGFAVGFAGSSWINRQPATVSPAYVMLSPPPDSLNSYIVADATLISARLHQQTPDRQE